MRGHLCLLLVLLFNATTLRAEDLPLLSKVVQKSSFSKGNHEEEFAPLILNNEALLITYTADAPEHLETESLQMARTLRQLALEMDLPRDLIYLSTTSIYGDHGGLWVDETGELLAKNDPAKLLIETEKLYTSLAELGWSVCVLRLAEIYGPGKELSKRVRELKGLVLPGLGNQYTNMVHKSDCSAAMDYALRHHLEGVFNVADDDHLWRKDLYDQIAQKLGLPKVKWDPSLTGLHGGNKRVSNHKIKAAGFAFRPPHRVLD